MTETNGRPADREKQSTKDVGYKTFPQLLAGFTANLTMFAGGMAFGWPAAALPKLRSPSSDLPLTSSDGAWIVSALQMGACLGPLFSAFLVNRIGRKWFMCGTGIPFVLCWILIYFAESFAWLFAGRFISGIGIGAIFSVVPMYLGEIAETRIRGTLGTLSSLMISGGSVAAYCVGPWVERKPLALVNLVAIAAFLLSFPWMPETPYYYLRKNNLEAARKSLAWLRGSDSVEYELSEMTKHVNAEMERKDSLVEIITVRVNRKATCIIWSLIAAQQLSGIGVFLSYANSIFEGTSLRLDPNIAGIITAMVLLVAHIAATCLVDRVGKKPLLLLSSYGASICLCVMGVYFCLDKSGVNVDLISWMPLVTILFFYIFYSLGLSPLPYAILSEIYPITVKAWATTVASIYGSIVGVLVTKLYQVVADAWGYHTIFFIFCIIETVIATFILYILPETKGKSFKEIQDILKNKRSFKISNCGF